MPWRTAASAVTSVPVPLISCVLRGLPSDARRLSQAMWMTTSAPSRTSFIVSSSRTSPTMSSAPPAMASVRLSSRPTLRSSTATASAPTDTSRSITWLPMKPAPPVTTTRCPETFNLFLPSVSVRPPREEDGGEGAEQKARVLPQRPVRDVQVVELHHLLERDARPPEDLPRSGEARREVEPALAPAVDLLLELRRHGPGADQAHVALQDVPELRQLVDARAPQQIPGARDARIVLEQQPRRVLAERPQLLHEVVRVHDHRPELVQAEAASAAADAHLREEDGPGRVELRRDRRDDQDRQRQQKQDGRDGDVHRPLHDTRGAVERGRVEPEHGQTLDVVDLHGRADRVDVMGHDADRDVELAHLADEVGQVVLDRGLDNDHAIHARGLADRRQVGDRAEVGQALARPVRPLCLGVDIADRHQPVLVMRADLAGEQASHRAAPDKEHALRLPAEPDQGADRGPQDERRHEGGAGEERALGEGEVLVADAAHHEPERERSDHESVEEPGHVVHRRVADALRVPVVEAVELEEDDPDRQRQEPQRNLLEPTTAGVEGEQPDRERRDDRHRVRNRQAAPEYPGAMAARPAGGRGDLCGHRPTRDAGCRQRLISIALSRWNFLIRGTSLENTAIRGRARLTL